MRRIIFLSISFVLLILIIRASLPEGRKTVVLNGNPLLVFSWQKDQDLIFLKLPGNLYATVSQDFGQYRLSSLWNLGKQEKLEGHLLRETVQELIGAPVDGYLSRISNLGTLKSLLELKKAETNLGLAERFQIWWIVKKSRADKIKVIDLAKSGVLQKKTLLDSSTVLIPDQEKVDRLLKDLFKDGKITNEQLVVEILNGSGQTGAGARAARLLTNSGVTVIGINNHSQIIGQCQLRGENRELKSLTAERIRRLFNCQSFLGKLSGSRSDLQIIVGKRS